MVRESFYLKDWIFQLGDDVECLKTGKKVTIPHTWNIQDGTEDSMGSGWYEHKLFVPEEWHGKVVQLRFHAVYHDAVVYLNGNEVGEHKNSGYTPFVIDVTGNLIYGEMNSLIVQANNAYSKQMLPYMRSFDWANDGGIIRDVELIVTGVNYIESLQTTAKPVILTENDRQDTGAAIFGFKAFLNGDINRTQKLEWNLSKDNSKEVICCGNVDCAGQTVTIGQNLISCVE